MTNRFQQALNAQNACNPAGLANTLVSWQREIIQAGGGTDTVRQDPACRLLAYQIAYLFNVNELYQNDYVELTKICEDEAAKV